LFLTYFGKPLVVATAAALPCTAFVHSFSTRNPFREEVPDTVLLGWLAENDSRNEFCASLIQNCYTSGRVIFGVSARIEQLEAIKALLIAKGIPEQEIGLYTRSYTSKSGKRKTSTELELNAIKEGVKTGAIKILLATYGMMKRGENMPRLDTGIDLTPASQGIQVVGRIRRPLEGKQMSHWHTINDVWHPILQRRTEARLRDYRKANVVISTTPYSHATN
jgi:superfamily II DNA or RNA helicase